MFVLTVWCPTSGSIKYVVLFVNAVDQEVFVLHDVLLVPDVEFVPDVLFEVFLLVLVFHEVLVLLLVFHEVLVE